jgi:type IV secretion system protein TrbH
VKRPVRSIALAAVLALGGCAAAQPGVSYVTEVTPADAAVLASDMADLIGRRLPAASSTLMPEPPPESQAGNALTPALRAALAGAGFTLAEPRTQTVPGAHSLRYLVTPLDGGVLVRLEVDRSAASRWYVRNSAGALQPGSPFTVREAGESTTATNP